MECRDPHAAAVGAHKRFDARAHLTGGLVGERDREDFLWLRFAVADEIGDAAGDYAGLSRPGASQDEERPFDVKNGIPLFGIERFEELHRTQG